MLSFFIGLRYTGARRRSQLVSFISAISMTGIVVSVALLVLVLSVMNGFDKELRERILSIVHQASLYHDQGVEDWQSLREQVIARDDVLAASPFVQLTGLISYRREAAPALINGVDIDWETQVSSIENYVQDQLPLLAEGSDAPLLVGKGLADKLELSAGSLVQIIVPDGNENNGLPKIRGVRVGAVVTTGTELDESLVLTNLSTAQSLSSTPDRVSGLRLRFADLFAAPSISYQLQRSLPFGYYTVDWTRSQGNLYQAIQLSRKLVGLLLVLIIGIAAFNVVSTLVMVVVDKQGDIAILRTLGASSQKIMGIFMVQGSMIGVLGTLAGLIIGLLLSLSVQDVVAWLEEALNIQFLHSDVYPISFVPSEILWTDLVSIAITALSLSFLATLYPAWRASRVRPAEALRFER